MLPGRKRHEGGYSLPELIAVLSMIAILTAIAIPLALTYVNASTALQGARDVRSRLNQARMLAIATRQPICVQFSAAGYQFRQGTCAGPAVINSQTGPTGVIGFAEPVSVGGVSPIFTQFGNASQNTVLTVTGPAGTPMTVTVSPSGRVTIP